MSSKPRIDGDRRQKDWINIALRYVPDAMLKEASINLAIIAIGRQGACRLPEQYRQGEIVLLSDWVFPPHHHSERDDTGRFFIVALLHEIAHAVHLHKSPSLDKLTPEKHQAQEDEADRDAIEWFNRYVELSNDDDLKFIETAEFHSIRKSYEELRREIEHSRNHWHVKHGT